MVSLSPIVSANTQLYSNGAYGVGLEEAHLHSVKASSLLSLAMCNTRIVLPSSLLFSFLFLFL